MTNARAPRHLLPTKTLQISWRSYDYNRYLTWDSLNAAKPLRCPDDLDRPLLKHGFTYTLKSSCYVVEQTGVICLELADMAESSVPILRSLGVHAYDSPGPST